MLCIHPEMTESLLEELHEEICESHTSGRSLAHKVITQGYWWPNIQREAQEYVKKCDQCQRFARRAYTNQEEFLIHYLVRGHLLNGA